MKKTLLADFYIGLTTYVNTEINWIRALGAEIIDFIDDGIFWHFRLPKPPKPVAVHWKTRIRQIPKYGLWVAKRFQIFKIYNLSPQSSDLVQNWCASLAACI